MNAIYNSQYTLPSLQEEDILSAHAHTKTSFMYMCHLLTYICLQIKSGCKYTTYLEL